MENQEQVAVYIALGSLVIFTLVIIIILFVVTYQRKMLEKENRIQMIEQEKQIQMFKATVEAEELLKEKIANNLHDSVNPMLALLKLNLSRHKIEVEKNKFNPESLKDDSKIIDNAIDGIRSSCKDLIPSFLLEFGLIKALEDYIRNLGKNENIHAELINHNPENKTTFLDKQDQLSAYRICMEILNNLFKHAGYTQLKLVIRNTEELFNAEFHHNGKGISNEEIARITESSRGQGLKSLKIRVLVLGGSLNYTNENGSPKIVFAAPVKQKEQLQHA